MLDAKKRNQQHISDHLRPNAYQAMNLSTGNLAMSNQNGKSASALQLQQPLVASGGQRPETSVDRWSVVMELLAQSRKKQGAGVGESGATGKRHSKQLDRFKHAARSAAAVTKHQRQHGERSLLETLAASPAPGSLSVQAEAREMASREASEQTVGAAGSNANAGGNYLVPGSLVSSSSKQQQLTRQQVAAADQSGSAADGSLQQPVQATSLLIQHTKSLPVGAAGSKLAPSSNGAHFAANANEQILGTQQQQQHFEHQKQYFTTASMSTQPTVHSRAHGAGSHAPQQQQQQPYNQLLNISSQQLQSTSGKWKN